MALLTTTDNVSQSPRLSIEKAVSAFVGIASTVVLLLSVFGVIEPAQAGEASTAIELLGGQLVEAAMVLLPVAILWYRMRRRKDAEP